MKKNIYKEIPEDFHEQFCDTLSRLEAASVKRRRRPKKYGIILAAAILACASVTAVAAGLMQWHEKLSEYFGTEKELEDKLSMKNVAVRQDAVAQGNGLEFRALQAVRADSYDYFLVEMTVPEDVQWNGDIIFETCEAGGGAYGCVANFIDNSIEDDKVLLELQVMYEEGKRPRGEEISVRLKNLVQTEELVVTEYLAEGEWKLSLSLPPAEADTVRFYPENSVDLGGHELQISKANISPFRLRLYTEQEFAMHAVWGHAVLLTGIWYEDGTVVEESGLNFSMAGHLDEAEDFCFEFALDNAVDTDKIEGILITDSGEERKVFLGKTGIEKEREESPNKSEVGRADGEDISEIHLLYVRYENVVLEVGGSVYLWDARCGGWQELFSLDEYGFSWENGGEFCMGNASQILFLPEIGSEEIYMYEIAEESMLTLEATAFWPWATYDLYQENRKEITDVISDADERYSRQVFRSQGGWYYLYSEDGKIGDMELRVTDSL